MYLDGYWGDRLSTGTHDPLRVKTLVFDDGCAQVALVAAHIISFYHQWVVCARAKQTAVAPEIIVICATHTHSSPCFVGMFRPAGAVDHGYIEWVEDRMARTVAEAAANALAAHIGFGRADLSCVDGEIPEFARNWHNPDVLDTELLIMQVTDAESRMSMANDLNFGNHPDVLSDRTTEVPADFLCYVYRDARLKQNRCTKSTGARAPLPRWRDAASTTRPPILDTSRSRPTRALFLDFVTGERPC